MRRIHLLLLALLLTLILPASGLCQDVTLAGLKAAGVQAMTKDEVMALVAQKRLYGEIGKWAQPVTLFDDGTLRGESCGKNDPCSSPAKGTGKWSVDEDGTFHLFLDWGRWGKHDWVGKLYKHEGYAYQFDGADENRSGGYRFKL